MNASSFSAAIHHRRGLVGRVRQRRVRRLRRPGPYLGVDQLGSDDLPRLRRCAPPAGHASLKGVRSLEPDTPCVALRARHPTCRGDKDTRVLLPKVRSLELDTN